MVFGVKHQETAAAVTTRLPAESAVATSELVPFVDLRVGDAHRALFLVFPVLVHQVAEGSDVPRFESRAAAHAELLDVVEVAQHFAIVRTRTLMLVGQDAAGA